MAALGVEVCVEDDLEDCDVGSRFAAVSLLEETMDEPFPEALLDVTQTFGDLIHYANLRRAQRGEPDIWIE